MTRLLRAELLKLRTTRTFYALAGAAIGTSLLITILVASLSHPTEGSVLADVFRNDTSSLFIMILAIVGITGEWRHRTITSSLLAAPDRARFLVAKTLAFGAAGALLSLVISISIAIVAYAILGERDLPTPALGTVIEQSARNVFVAGLLGAFAVGVGSLIRNQATAVVAILVFSFVVDNLLAAFAPGVERFSPTGALPDAALDYEPGDVGMDKVNFLAPGLATLCMLLWICAAYAAGRVLLRSRDLE